MKAKVRAIIQRIQRFYNDHKALTIRTAIAACIVPAAVVIACSLLINSDKKYILASTDNRHTAVGIVLGAGITKDGRPFRELQARLDSAAQALQKGQINKLILSGDNRFASYNEPDAMKNYLVDSKHIPAGKLQPDYAGRSTYESCERASRVFGLHKTIIFSAESHLPRAIFLCRHFGIETYGISSGVEANNSGRRELLARVKAVFNAHVHGEKTILGSPIHL